MKKIDFFRAIFIVALLISLVACGNSSPRSEFESTDEKFVKYQQAVSLEKDGKYEEAFVIFRDLEDYRDSAIKSRTLACQILADSIYKYTDGSPEIKIDNEFNGEDTLSCDVYNGVLAFSFSIKSQGEIKVYLTITQEKCEFSVVYKLGSKKYTTEGILDSLDYSEDMNIDFDNVDVPEMFSEEFDDLAEKTLHWSIDELDELIIQINPNISLNDFCF